MEIENKPLTLKQLKEKLKKNQENPVWLNIKGLKGWGIAWGYNSRTMRFTTKIAYHTFLDVAEYGKTWFAYDYPPARIDRGKWWCEWCCDGSLFDSDSMRIDLYHPLKPGQQSVNPNYCPMCGRPLTDDAWAELERRVFGE